MDLSPLKCAVADKHRVLPVFSRNRPAPIPLDATLTRVLVSVHSKQFTGKLSYLESALTENTGGGLRPLQRATRRSYLAAALKPFPFMLLRTLLHRAKSQPLYFQAFPHSCPKTPGVGGIPQRSNFKTFKRFPRPIAAQSLWCNNLQRRGISSPPGETTPLPPVSKDSERTSGTVRRSSRFTPTRSGSQVVPGSSVLRQWGWTEQQGGSSTHLIKDAGRTRAGKAGSVRLG
jgi:hypothetical protein